MDNESQITTYDFAPRNLGEAMELAKQIADSGMFGLKKPSQVITLQILARDRGKSLSELLLQYHFHHDGKISQKANYTQGDFERNSGHIIWHIRTDEMVAATFVAGEVTKEVRERALTRFRLQWELDNTEDANKRGELIEKINLIAWDKEVTVIRTYEDADSKGLIYGNDGKVKTNWSASPRQMLTARVVTEGVGVVAPGLAAGVPDEDTVTAIRQDEQRESVARIKGDTKEQQLEYEINELLEKAKMDVTDGEKSRLLGRAAELRTELAEIRRVKPEPESGQELDLTPPSGEASPEPTVTVEPPQPPDWRSYRLQGITNKAYLGRAIEELTSDELEMLVKRRATEKHLTSDNKAHRTDAKMLLLAWEAHHQEILAQGRTEGADK